MRERNGTMTGKVLQRLPRWGSGLIMAFALIALAAGFWWGVSYHDRKLRVKFLDNARMVSRAIDWRLIRELSASEADLLSPAYRRIKEQLTSIHQAASNNRFVYLLKQKSDGTVIILVDSEAPSSKDYSPPGQEYQEVSPAIRQVFSDNREAAVGPVNDRWGRWISAVIPVVDPETGTTVALLGMDIDGRDWNRDLVQETLESMALILVIVLPLSIYVIQRRRIEQSLRMSRDEWQNTFDSMPDLIAILDTDYRIVRANRAMRQKLGLECGAIVGQPCYRYMHHLDAPPDFCPHAKLLKDSACHAEEVQLPVLNGDYSISVTPLHDTAGTLTGSIHIAHDITLRKRAEEELHDSEERYRMLFNEALIGICMADVETGVIIDCNQAMAELTGRPIAELIGAHQSSLHPPQESSSLLFSPTFLLHKNEATGTVLSGQLITASGEIREVEIKARAFAFRDRQVMLGTFNDVTERNRAEVALRESKEHYKSLYRLIRLMCDNVPDLIWAKDMDRRYIFANKTMCEILLGARDTQEPIGRDDTFFSERERGRHPEEPNWHTYGEICANTDLEVMTSKKGGRFEDLGYVKGQQLYLDVSKAPFWDEEGAMIGTVGCGRDVTKVKQLEQEHKKAEELLRHNEEHLRRAEEMGHLGHWSLDLKTSEQTWSDEMYRIYGVTPEEFQPGYESIFQLVHPDDHEARIRSYVTVRQEGKANFEYRVVRPDGEQRIISGTAEMQYDSSGEAQAMFGTVLDITELRLKESELHRKNAEMERFTYTVSHDLRSPLVTIKTFLGFLEQDLAADDPERVTQDIAYIHGAADKMRRLLDDLIEMSRVGRIVNIPTQFSFQELVEQTLVIVAGQITTLGVDVTIQQAELSFFADRARLTEIWQNLLDNAVKYMGNQPEPRIEIGVSGTGRDTVFFVRDNGIGIAPQHTEKIFRLFEKLDNKSEGTGLGLTLVKRIVEMNGGRIWVESDGEGQGACFRFTLPDALMMNHLTIEKE